MHRKCRLRLRDRALLPRQGVARWLFCALMLGQTSLVSAQNTIVGDALCRQPVAGLPNTFLFTFGYESAEASPVLLLPGAQNFFTPQAGNRGQLSTFYPGRHSKAFRIAFDLSVQESFNWVLQNRQHLISKRSPRCAPEAVPLAPPFPAVSGVAGSPNILANLSCIELIPNGYRAVFGYESFERNPVLIAAGASNNIAPNSAPQRQLTTLYPGYSPRAFRVEVTAVAPALAGDITWNFLGQARLAGLTSPICVSETGAPIAGALSLASGGNQSAAINTPFPQAIRVNVLLGGFATEGVVLRASAPSSGASASFVSATATTDVNGIARFNARANGIAGAYSISVTRSTEALGPSISVGLVNQ